MKAIKRLQWVKQKMKKAWVGDVELERLCLRDIMKQDLLKI